jgi:hypothetical protein
VQQSSLETHALRHTAFTHALSAGQSEFARHCGLLEWLALQMPESQ